ncbi:MAG: polysaccharide deacetylase family protein [Oscillospiraceae bacterium]|nr:polysaccharide deacetylase family protein [Oscillospiraceae bacterium]
MKKKVFVMVISAAMTFGLLAVHSAAEGLTALDALAVLKHVAGVEPLSAEQRAKLDFAEDRLVTTADALAVLKKAVGTGTLPDAPERIIDPSKPMIALTFDDGPNTTNAVLVLDELEKRGIVATFFVIGGNINDQSAEVMKRSYGLGNEFANHSWGWNSMGGMEAENIIKSLTDTSNKIVEVLGENARPKFFRAPNLNTSPAMIETVAELGYPLMEGIMGNDWEGNATPESIFNLVVPKVKDGSIILLHDGGSNNATAEGIGAILDALIEEGFQFVTLSELFELKGVEIEAGKKYASVG